MSTGSSRRAAVAYAAQRQKLELRDLTFDYEAEDPALGALAEAFHEPIRQALEAAANEALAPQLERLGGRLGTVLEKKRRRAWCLTCPTCS